MTLNEKQVAFTVLVARLILHAQSLDYGLTFGEAWRTPEMAAIYAKRGTGSKTSLHLDRLAVDLNLFQDGQWLTTTLAHEPLGLWWEAQSTPTLQCCWGGRFNDANHYSVAHGGRK